ncbi:acetyl-CoA synthetase-like protein [Jaminaea rosea]|uniref:Acetyl-CoA synthetase-like protein n=1 Tax=Jaminaea rosea TaxID=1569628 RepID=A0A316UMM1_9BASI|nr:acetyl-CoA synthetase-like protein [Jaminaea rosea]PWN26542.1 acetyl-CoA synthetase-like protein [Jaminaea rosea]
MTPSTTESSQPPPPPPLPPSSPSTSLPDSLPPSRVPRLDVFHSSSSHASAPTTSARANVGNGIDSSQLVVGFARWLLRLLNAEEACFLYLCSQGRSLILAAGSADLSKCDIVQHAWTEEAPTDFLVVGPGGNAPSAAGRECVVAYRDDTTIELTAPHAALLASGLVWSLASPSSATATPRPSSLNYPLTSWHQNDDELLHSAFEDQAMRCPDQTALDYLADEKGTHIRLTYAELDKRANVLAATLSERIHALEQHPEWPGSIPLLLGPSPALYISQLAALKAGLAFAPLPIDAPSQRLTAIIQDQHAPVALYSSDATDPPAIEGVQWLDVADLNRQQTSDETMSPGVKPLKPLAPASLAYLLYTSGSTGLPKGVQITHSSAVASISAHRQQAGIGNAPSMRWFQFAAPTFDPSVMEIFVTLSSGATLCTALRSLTLNDINETVAATEANIMMATPSLATLLRRDRLPKLRTLWTMGEALSSTVIDNFAKAQPPASLWNAYGPTEAAINVTLMQMLPSYRGTILGPPLPSASLFVVDAQMRPVPQGLAGELILGGPQVSQLGYLNRPKENAASFVDVPELGGRVYRTGDAARVVWNAEGQPWIEILGRIGHGRGQVKVHGQRLELAEVESALHLSDEDDVATVHVMQIQSGSLAALVQTRSELVEAHKSRLEDTLREQASRRLAPFARPRAYVFTSQRFSSISGKLDSKAAKHFVQESLSTQAGGNGEDDNAGIDPTIRRQIDTLVETMRSITGSDSISAKTSLEATGLDSLGAMRLLETLRGCDSTLSRLTLRDLVSPQSARKTIARFVADAQRESSDSSAATQQIVAFDERHRQHCCAQLGLEDATMESVIPVTATQAGMLASFLRSHSYVHHFCYHLDNDVDLDRFAAAAEEVFSGAAAMRSVFVSVDDEVAPFAQCVLKSVRHPVSRHASGDVEKHLSKVEEALSLESPPFHHALFQPAGTSKPVYAISLFHGIFDGGSLELLLNDVRARYAGRDVILRTGPTYAAKTYLEATTGTELEQTRTYWSDLLQGFEAEVFPCINGLRRGLPETQGSAVLEHCPDDIDIAALTDAAQRLLGTRSPLALVQLAWCLVLSAYSETSKTDIVFGSVVSNRIDEEARSCAAPTFTTLPVRIDVEESRDIVTIFSDLARQSVRALPHSQPALGSITVDGGKLPYDTLVALQLFEDDATQEPALWHDEWSPAMVNDFAVMLEVWPSVQTASGLRLRATYEKSRLDVSSCKVMLQQFAALLSAMTQSDMRERSLGDLLTSVTSQQAALGAKVGSATYESDFLHSQFETFVQTSPNQVALAFYGEKQLHELSYRKLDALSSSLASRIVTANGGRPLTDTAVPLYANKSVEMYIAVLAILKAGGAWCPIEPSMPRERKAKLIKRAGGQIVVVASKACLHEEDKSGDEAKQELERVLQDAGVPNEHVVDASAMEETLHCELPARASPSTLAYVIWTSGSTGEPKGVLIEHRAAAQAMRALQSAIPHQDGLPPRTICFSAFTFDVFVEDIFYTWGLGGTVVSAPRNTLIDPDGFAQLAADSQATHSHLTPAFGACIARERCPSLQTITMIGEKLGEEVAAQWEGDDSHGTTAWNTYGPAENAVVSTYRSFQHGRTHQAPNVGWPLDGTTCLVVRPNRAVAMRGGVGELGLGGGQVARGYLGDPEKTADRYPTLPEHGRVYLTGDVVRMLADGSLDFVGRRDDLIKVGGIRVELSEISHALARCHESVRHVETLYLSLGGEGGGKAIVSFLLAVEDANGDRPEDRAVKAAARAQAQKALPAYMHPAHYVVVDSIPRSTSAKTDTRALAATFLRQREQRTNNAEEDQDGSEAGDNDSVPDPSSPQGKLAHIVLELLDASSSTRLTRRTSLRSLGLDSIRTIRLATKLRAANFPAVAAFQLMKCETFGQLCDVVAPPSDAGNGHAGGMSTDELQAQEQVRQRLEAVREQWMPALQSHPTAPMLVDVLPTTALQAALLTETAKSSGSYWSTSIFDLKEHVDADALRSAWVKVTEEFEILRTTFIATAQGYLQGVLEPSAASKGVELQAVEGSAGIDKRTVTVAQSRASSSPPSPFYWALTLVQHPRQLAVHMHHALYDGPAFDQMISRVEEHLKGNAKPLKTAVSLRDTLVLLGPSAISWPNKSTTHNASAFTELLKPRADRCGPWMLPNLTGAKAVKRPQMQAATIDISADATKLSDLARQYDLPSSAAIVQAAFGCLVADYLDQGAVLIGATLSERGRQAQLESSVFPLVVTVPFLIDGGRMTEAERKQATPDEIRAFRGMSVGELLKELAGQWRKSSGDARYVAASEVRKALDWPRDQAIYPALFVVHDNAGDDEAACTSEQQILSPVRDPAKLAVEHGLALNVYSDAKGHPSRLVVSASETFLPPAHIEVLAKQIEAQITSLLEAKADTPLSRLSNLEENISNVSPLYSISSPVITDENTAAAASRHPCYWLRHWAQKHPGRTAAMEIVGEAGGEVREWSFRDLDQKSNALAWQIRSTIGEKPCVVALCMGRTLEAFAAILAIFKLGCTYLPIAEDLPVQRKQDLVKDAGAAAVLTTFELQKPFEGMLDQIIVLDEIKLDASKMQELELPPARSCGYLLYTSGSTGKPKGVSVSGANLSGYIEGFAALVYRNSVKSHHLTEAGGGRYLTLASRAFDPHLSQMFLPWRMGYAVVTGERNAILEDLTETVRLLSITHMGILPSLLEHSGMTPDKAPSLVGIAVGGEKITQFILDEWAPATPGQTPLVVNAYGPTEVTIGCTMAVVTKQATPGHIGLPVGETTALVLLPGTQTVARRGQSGELCFAGDLVAHGGYLGRGPDEQGGFSTFGGTRIYRTGDMARMLHDGSISFLGRADEQVKIRGQRLELGEVNATVRVAAAEVRKQTISSQKAVTVYAKHPSLASSRLFTVLSMDRAHQVADAEFVDCEHDDEARSLVEAVTKMCSSKMPAFMVPTIVVVPALPQLPSGKFDVKKTIAALQRAPVDLLLRTSKAAGGGSAGQSRNLNALESAILAAVCELTDSNVEDVTRWARPSTSIFELGVDSLTAVGLSVRLREQPLQISMSVADVLANDTLESLAAYAERAEDADGGNDAEWYDTERFDAEARQELKAAGALEGTQPEWIRPTMPLQESLVTLTRLACEQNGDGPLPYIHCFRIKSTRTNVAALWRESIKREPMLRTVFKSRGNGLVQAVLPADAPELQQLILEGAPSVALPARMIDAVGQVPPLRVFADESTGFASVWLHHAIYDGSTLPTLLRDVYDDVAAPVRPANNPSDNAVLAQAARSQSAKALRFWQRHLENVATPHRPLAKAAAEEAGRPVARKRFTMGIDLTSRLRAAAQSSRIGTTLSTLTQSAFALLLARLTQCPDVVLGNVVSGRSSAGEMTSMPLVATVPVRHSFGAATLADALVASKKSNAAVKRWEHTSLRNIQSAVGRGGLFDVLFSYDGARAQEHKSSSYEVLEDEGDSAGGVDYPLVLNVTDKGQELGATLVYSTTEIDEDVANALVTQLQLLLSTIAEGSNPQLTELGLSFDHTALSAHASGASSLQRPLNHREEQVRDVLLQLVSDVDRKDVQPGTSFYRIGLDSLVALRFARELKRSGIEGLDRVSAAKIVASGNLARLCAEGETQVDDKTTAVGEEEVNGDEASASRDIARRVAGFEDLFVRLNSGDECEASYVCTPLQAGMLTLSRDSPHSAYHQIHRFRLRGDVDVQRLCRAWDQVVEHNDVLRSTFHLDETHARWVAQVHTKVGSDASGDFSAQPPAYLTLSDDDKVASFHIHHALYDGASLPVIFDQVRAAYHGQELPPYRPFWSAAQRSALDREQATAAWAKLLEGYKYAPITAQIMARRHRSTARFAAPPSAAYRSLGVTLHAVCVLSYARALSQNILGLRDVCFGHVLDGRSDETDADVIGPLFNTVARRVTLGDLLETNAEGLVRTQQSLDNGAQWQAAADLRGVTAAWRAKQGGGSSKSRVFDCLFVYHKAQQKAGTSAAAEPLWHRVDDDEEAEAEDEYDVNVSITEHASGELSISANSVVGGQEGLDALVQEIARQIGELVNQPHSPMPAAMRVMPLTTAGELDGDRSESDDDNSPLDSDEEALCDALSTMMPHLSDRSNWRKASTNVPELGIDSITAIKLASMCRKRGGVVAAITVPIILRGQTVRAVVKAARRSVKAKGKAANGAANGAARHQTDDSTRTAAADMLSVSLGDIEDVFAVLPGQEHHLDSWHATGRRFYEAPWALRIQGDVDGRKMMAAWTQLLSRHAVLRSTFAQLPGSEKPVQVVMRASEKQQTPFGWSIHKAESSLEIEAQRVIEEGNSSSSSLYEMPARLALVQGSDTSIIVMRLHHAQYDAWSIAMILDELQALYEGREPSTEPCDFANLARSLMLEQDKATLAKEWWKRYLGDAEPTCLSQQEKEKATAQGPVVLVRSPGLVTGLASLEEQASRVAPGVNLSHVVILALARVLVQRSNATRRPTLGFYTAGRAAVAETDPEAAAAAVPLLNVLPLAVSVGKNEARKQLEAVRDDLLERVQWEQSRLRDVVGGNDKMFDVFLNLLWHRGGQQEDAPLATTGEEPVRSAKWERWTHPSSSAYFTSTQTHDVNETTLRDLSTEYLPRHKCYIDVRRDVSGDCLSFGLKADVGMLAQEEEATRQALQALAEQVAKEVGMLMEQCR